MVRIQRILDKRTVIFDKTSVKFKQHFRIQYSVHWMTLHKIILYHILVFTLPKQPAFFKSFKFILPHVSCVVKSSKFIERWIKVTKLRLSISTLHP